MNKNESVLTVNATAPAAHTVSLAALDEIACDMASSLELLQAAEQIILFTECTDGDENSPLYAVVSRALAELRGQHEVLCAML